MAGICTSRKGVHADCQPPPISSWPVITSRTPSRHELFAKSIPCPHGYRAHERDLIWRGIAGIY
jgi:hypothetical protein